MPAISKKSLYLDRDGDLVEETDPSVASLLVGAGGMLTDAQIEQYAIATDDLQPLQEYLEANGLMLSSPNYTGEYPERFRAVPASAPVVDEPAPRPTRLARGAKKTEGEA